MGKVIGLILGGIVCGVGAVALLANDMLIFGVGLAFLSAVLAGFGVYSIKDNELAFKITGITVIIIVLVTGISLNAVNDSGTSWGDLSDEEKENAKWAYEVKEAIDDYDD